MCNAKIGGCVCDIEWKKLQILYIFLYITNNYVLNLILYYLFYIYYSTYNNFKTFIQNCLYKFLGLNYRQQAIIMLRACLDYDSGCCSKCFLLRYALE